MSCQTEFNDDACSVNDIALRYVSFTNIQLSSNAPIHVFFLHRLPSASMSNIIDAADDHSANSQVATGHESIEIRPEKEFENIPSSSEQIHPDDVQNYDNGAETCQNASKSSPRSCHTASNENKKCAFPASKTFMYAHKLPVHHYKLDYFIRFPGYRVGKLPKYLIEMREREAEKCRLEAIIDPNCPPGHTALGEEERLETLNIAHKKQQDLIDELNRLPMTSRTLRIRNRQIEIEKELNRLDEIVKIFSRLKVYVKNESTKNGSHI